MIIYVNTVMKNRKKFIAILAFLLIDAIGLVYIAVDYKADVYTIENPQYAMAYDEDVVDNDGFLAQVSEAITVDGNTNLNLPQLSYIEIMSGCGPYFSTGECINVRSGPGTEYPVQTRLRTGVVLHVDSVLVEGDGRFWYKVIQDRGLRYAERVNGDWYVAVDDDSIRTFSDVGPIDLADDVATTTKRVVINLTEERLYAYDGDMLYLEEDISSGLDLTPTPRGVFYVYRKTPSRYMQGPLPGISSQYYDLPGVPWNLYFTYQGAVIHGAYWHDKFGEAWSHGCANLPLDTARVLYEWADLGMEVRVTD